MDLKTAATLVKIGVDYGIPVVSAGGPGSGCHGPNCGRKSGPHAEFKKIDKRLTKMGWLPYDKPWGRLYTNPQFSGHTIVVRHKDGTTQWAHHDNRLKYSEGVGAHSLKEHTDQFFGPHHHSLMDHLKLAWAKVPEPVKAMVSPEMFDKYDDIFEVVQPLLEHLTPQSHSALALLPHLMSAEDKCPHCGSSEFSLMPTDFETAKCDKCGKTWNYGVEAGGPGSGRHPEFKTMGFPKARRNHIKWAVHPEHGLMFDNDSRTHLDWFGKIGMPTEGTPYDHTLRGYIDVNDQDKTATVHTYPMHDPVGHPNDYMTERKPPEAVQREAREHLPETKNYRWSEEPAPIRDSADQYAHPERYAASGIGAFSPSEARDEKGRWTDEGGSGTRYAGPPIPVSEFPLTREEDNVELKFRRQILNQPEKAVADYKKANGNILDADRAKELSEDYRNDRNKFASAVHEPSSWLVKEIYKSELAKPAPEGKRNDVVFMAGGAASGKSTMIEGNPAMKAEVQKAQIVYDGTGTSLNTKVKQALDAGKEAHIMYVYRDPTDAFINGAIPRAEDNGRVIVLAMFADQHIASRNGIEKLAAQYKDNPKVHITVIDNSRGFGNARISTLKDLPEIERDKIKLRTKLKAALDEQHEKGKVSDEIYKATIGPGIDAAITGGSSRGVLTGVFEKLERWRQESRENSVAAGGPGSGCHGPNCGRAKGSTSLPNTLGIMRRNLPQIRKEYVAHYLNWLQKQGVGYKIEHVNPEGLKPIQRTIEKGVVDKLPENTNIPGRPMIISKDSYILDGHHRWYKAMNNGHEPLKAVRVDSNMKNLLALTKQYPHVQYSDSHHNPVLKAAEE